jgi:hypothetical protein
MGRIVWWVLGLMFWTPGEPLWERLLSIVCVLVLVVDAAAGSAVGWAGVGVLVLVAFSFAFVGWPERPRR